jgi:hypothetical protein
MLPYGTIVSLPETVVCSDLVINCREMDRCGLPFKKNLDKQSLIDPLHNNDVSLLSLAEYELVTILFGGPGYALRRDFHRCLKKKQDAV